MSSVSGQELRDLGNILPGLREGATNPVGVQRWLTVPLGIPTLADGATYNNTIFIAPCNGCVIKELWLTGVVKVASGTNTFAVDNYDISAAAARNVQSATNIDPDTVTAKTGLKLTLSTTLSALRMDEGDVLNTTLVLGTQSTAGQGYSLTACIVVPEIQ